MRPVPSTPAADPVPPAVLGRCVLTPRAFRQRQRAPAPEVPVIVVLAAAVAAVLENTPHRVVAVRPAAAGSWAVEGRRSIFVSHQPRRTWDLRR